MQGGGEQIVELVERAHPTQALAIEQTRVLQQLGPGLGLHGVQEHAPVNLPVEAAADGMAARRQIQW